MNLKENLTDHVTMANRINRPRGQFHKTLKRYLKHQIFLIFKHLFWCLESLTIFGVYILVIETPKRLYQTPILVFKNPKMF